MITSIFNGSMDQIQKIQRKVVKIPKVLTKRNQKIETWIDLQQFFVGPVG